ncbi:hypothetical protein NFI96_031409 [Prochilodus magdalenae]|nr:hypothetical protein NFI96_031409 [Prochilodus magdalenae]
MEHAASSLQEQALKRKERLKALREKQLQGREQADGEPESKRALEEAEAEERHRGGWGSSSGAALVEQIIQLASGKGGIVARQCNPFYGQCLSNE